MVAKTEGKWNGGFLMSEARGQRSRSNRVVLSGQNLVAGSVVGAVIGTAVAAANAGNTGNGAMGAVTVGLGAVPGVYSVVMIEPGTNLGTFRVEDPLGVFIGTGVVGTLFNKGGLSFTLADGATDFVAGDGFIITVAAGSQKLKLYDPANTDGTGTQPVGVLLNNVDASATGTNADTAAAMIARDAEVNAQELVWFAGATQNQKDAALAQLAALGIIAR